MSRVDASEQQREPFVPVVEGTPEQATVFSCPLCGGRFTHGRQVCGACPLNAGCSLVSCPGCGYTFPRSSRIVDWLRRRFGRTESSS